MKAYVIDAFTNEIFKGNPAAVYILQQNWLDESLMQNLAKEHNLSETAFILKDEQSASKHRYKLRWLTPKQEIDLCGHATLAAAFAVMNFEDKEASCVYFETKSGILEVSKKGRILKMSFPAFKLEKVAVSEAMREAIGQEVLEAYMGRDLICVLRSSEAVKRAEPNLQKLLNLQGALLHITARDSEFDCLSRSFAPKLGVNEDPVCGSGHCHLVPLWAEKLGKNEILAYQASSRGGILHCALDKDRVILGGEAVLFSVNEICL